VANSRAFNFYVYIDAMALATNGNVLEQFPYEYIAPIGLMTHGFVCGEGDFWKYDDAAVNPNWTEDDA
jgi:hypothetical protein